MVLMKPQLMTLFYLTSRATPSWYIPGRGGQNDCSL